MNQTSNSLASFYPNSLVQTEAASSFLSLAGTETGRKAFLGDTEALDQGAAPYITMAHIAMRDGVQTVGRLFSDATRTEVAKHEAAQIVAERTIEQLQKSKASIVEHAEHLLSSAQNEANEGFRLNPERRFVQEQILNHLRSLAIKPEGFAELRKILDEDSEAAAVFASTKGYLLGMSSESHKAIHFKLIEKHLPQVWAKMGAEAELFKLPASYDKAINSVRTSFYNPAMAAKASTRVSI